MCCCGLFVWAFWAFTLIASIVHSSVAITSIGAKWKCDDSFSACIGNTTSIIINNTTKTGAIITSFATCFQALLLLSTLISNKRRFQGYCIGSAFHITILMLWYAVMLNTSSNKIEQWSISLLKNLIITSYSLSCILAAVHFMWVFIIFNLIANNRVVCVGEA